MIWEALWRIAKTTIPVPLALIAAGAIWLQVDKTSAIRKAVNQRVTELVAGAEIAALKAQAEASQKVADEHKRRADEYLTLQTTYALRLAQEREQAQQLQDDLDDLAALPPPAACSVDRGTLDRLRSE